MVTALSSYARRPVIAQPSSCSIKVEAKKLEQASKIQSGSKGIDVEEWPTPDPGRFTPRGREPVLILCQLFNNNINLIGSPHSSLPISSV